MDRIIYISKGKYKKDRFFSRIGREKFAIVASNTGLKESTKLVEGYDFTDPMKKIAISIGVAEYTKAYNNLLLFLKKQILLHTSITFTTYVCSKSRNIKCLYRALKYRCFFSISTSSRWSHS